MLKNHSMCNVVTKANSSGMILVYFYIPHFALEIGGSRKRGNRSLKKTNQENAPKAKNNAGIVQWVKEQKRECRPKLIKH